MNEHVLDDLDAYALGALDRATAERVAAHLAECPSCRRQAAELAEVVAALPDAVALREPPPDLRGRLLTSAREPAASRVATPGRWSLSALQPIRVAFAALVAVLVVLAAVDVDLSRQMTELRTDRDAYYAVVEGIREGGRIWYMAGRDSFAGSGGTLVAPRAQGKQPFVLFHDLPPIPEGKVLTVWLVSPDNTWARAATFRPDGHDVQAVGISMEVAGFDRCAVTLEGSAWGPRSGAVVMESRIAPPAG